LNAAKKSPRSQNGSNRFHFGSNRCIWPHSLDPGALASSS
jgi:hypothetical protein